jgi:hypothetical protein
VDSKLVNNNDTLRRRVFIAGPLSKGDRRLNVRHAIDAGLELMRAGYAPLIPHLTDFVDPDDSFGHSTWVEVSAAWVAVAEAVLRLPGESSGADTEVEVAKKLGIPVFSSLESLIQAMKVPTVP